MSMVTDNNSVPAIRTGGIYKNRSEFYLKCLLITAIVIAVFACYVQAQYLIHNTIMTCQHKAFLYGLFASAGLGATLHIGLQILFNRR